MSLAEISLATNKSNYLPGDDRREVRQDEKGLVLPVHILDAETDYDLTGMALQFNEMKLGDKVVIDNGKGDESGKFEIVDAKSGKFKYTLQKQVYAESGTCWFSIMKGDEIIDTTKDFYIDVDKAAAIHVDNDNYVSELQAQINNLKATVQRCKDTLDQMLATSDNKVTAAINDSKKRLDEVIGKFNTYDAKYNQLIADWTDKLTEIVKAASDERASIQASADAQLSSNKKANDDAIALANKNFGNKLAAFQADYDAWKKTATIDFQKQLDDLKSKLKDDEKAQADLESAIKSAQSAVDKIQDVDFTKFAHKEDLANIHTFSNPEIVDDTVNPDSILTAGIYYSKNAFSFSKKSMPSGYHAGRSYLFVLDGDNAGSSVLYQQQFLFQANKFDYTVWYRAGYKYGTDSYWYVAWQDIKDDLSKLKQISINGGTPVGPDSKGVVNLTVPNPDLSGLETKADAKAAHDSFETKADAKSAHDTFTTTVNSIKGDITTMKVDIEALKKREIFHYSDTEADGATYSSKNPNVFVGTP